jgi:hypothetical protein
MSEDSAEVRFVRLELGQEVQGEEISKLQDRVQVLERDHSEQVGILGKLGQTVETLADTVEALSKLTKELDKSQEVFKARFNLIVGILSTIGVAVIAGVVKLLFFSGS